MSAALGAAIVMSFFLPETKGVPMKDSLGEECNKVAPEDAPRADIPTLPGPEFGDNY